MSTTEFGTHGPIKWTDAQRAEIADEMDHILADSRFNTSQRCVTLLQHLVENAVNGDRDRIKERTLGMDVFGRDPDYDVNLDPIVRRTASELRKRLAQYYQDPELQHIVRIRLVAGSYVPHFDFACHELLLPIAESKEIAGSLPALESIEAHRTAQPKDRSGLLVKLSYCGVAVLLVLGIGYAVARADFWRSTGYLLWKPFLDTNQGLFLCLPDDRPTSDANTRGAEGQSRGGSGGEGRAAGASGRADEIPSRLNAAGAMPKVLFADATIAYRIFSRLSKFGGTVALRTSSMVMLHQFRRRPAVLVGGFNNPWSILFLSKFRYSLKEDPATGEKWIQDAQNPSNREWKVGPEQGETDYALVTRCWDPDTGGWIMVLSGLGTFGTETAAVLVTDPSMESLLPRNLRTAQNYQIVLKTSVVNRSTGSPQILSVHTW